LSKHILNYRKKQTGTLLISENITVTNDDVMNYVIGALQQKLPRAPLPFNPALLVLMHVWTIRLPSPATRRQRRLTPIWPTASNRSPRQKRP